MSDADNTGESAIAFLDDIELEGSLNPRMIHSTATTVSRHAPK